MTHSAQIGAVRLPSQRRNSRIIISFLLRLHSVRPSASFYFSLSLSFNLETPTEASVASLGFMTNGLLRARAQRETATATAATATTHTWSIDGTASCPA